MGSRVAAGVKIFACLLFGCSVVVGFKAHDFKKCNDSSFCSRNRGVKPDPGYALDASSLVVAGATAQAVLLRHLEDGATQKLFLTLTSYGETVRVKVNEEPERRRYEVVDVLLPSVDAMATPWSSWTADATGARLKVGDNTEIVMEFDPFSMEVTVAGESAMEFNRRGMLSMEHKREKKEEDPAGMWEETFNSHKDTKPRGPSAVSFDLSFPKASHVYGLPERATALSLQPTAGEGVDSEPYRLYNLDVFEYLHDSPFGLYGSIPLLMAHRPELTTAAFLLNAAETYVDVAKPEGSETHTQWISESGVLDLFLMLGPGPGAVLRQYSALTGGTAMPPLFALGYHQCRWNYRDEADVAAVDAGFDEHAMPYDVLWLDIEHTNGKRYMTWDSKLFPDPEKMQRDVASRRRKMVTIVDPHVKRDQNYDLHKEAAAKKFYVRNKDGGDFDGWCWPGSSSYLDVLDPSVRTWWSDRFLPGRYQGATDTLYIWNDMNEPSVFNGPEITMPKDNLHFGDVEHRDVHNVYGLFYHMATADGLRRRGVAAKGSDGDRPFVLSRAFFAGTQRVGPIWTGDNLANWEHLQVSVPMVLTLNLAGLPWSGADVGGFFGNPSEELLTRWYQLGIYYPFFRAHAHLETKRREPWLFGEETSRRIRRALQDRYRLLPYTYTLFRHANLTGQPVMRPLWFDFPRQQQLFAEQQQFMLGPALLVAPALQQGQQQVQIPLPAGTQWYCSVTGERRDTAAVAGVLSLPLDMESIPVLIRGGSIIPQRERPRRSSAAMANDPFTLVVAADGDGRAVGELYLDDGHSFAFQRGVYLHRRFELRPDVDIRSGGRRLVLVNSALPVTGGELPGKMQSELEIERIVVLGMVGNLDKYRPEVAGKPKHTLTAHAGTPSLLHAPQSRHALVLRKPGLKISEDWQINLT